MRLIPGDEVLVAVEAHLLSVLGQDSGRASVSFLGTDRIDVLRFSPRPDTLVHYVTLGMSRAPMTSPTATVVDDAAPRAELMLSVLGAHDTVLRRLAMLASAPAVEGVVVRPGASLEVGEPLWDGARFASVLVGEPDLVPDLELGDGRSPVRFLPLLPMTANETALKRAIGAEELQARWAEAGVDLRDPARKAVA